jgi:hypothetical protein
MPKKYMDPTRMVIKIRSHIMGTSGKIEKVGEIGGKVILRLVLALARVLHEPIGKFSRRGCHVDKRSLSGLKS